MYFESQSWSFANSSSNNKNWITKELNKQEIEQKVEQELVDLIGSRCIHPKIKART